MGKLEKFDKDVRLKELGLQKEQIGLWKEAVQKGAPILNKYVDKKNNVDGSRIKWSIIGFTAVLFIITVLTGFLVYVGKVDASNFTFLMGTLIGASITLLGDIIIPEA